MHQLQNIHSIKFELDNTKDNTKLKIQNYIPKVFQGVVVKETISIGVPYQKSILTCFDNQPVKPDKNEFFENSDYTMKIY